MVVAGPALKRKLFDRRSRVRRRHRRRRRRRPRVSLCQCGDDFALALFRTRNVKEEEL